MKETTMVYCWLIIKLYGANISKRKPSIDNMQKKKLFKMLNKLYIQKSLKSIKNSPSIPNNYQFFLFLIILLLYDVGVSNLWPADYRSFFPLLSGREGRRRKKASSFCSFNYFMNLTISRLVKYTYTKIFCSIHHL